MYYTPILFDIMALYKKRSQCSRSSQVSGTALLVSRGSGGEVGGRPPENLARPRSEPLPRAWGADLNSSRACAVSEPSGPALAHMCTTRCTAGAQGVPGRGKSVMQTESNLPLMKRLPEDVVILIKGRMGEVLLKK